MSSDSDLLSHFSPLDELVQVIYQGTSRFVVLSSVDDASWTVRLGLSGEEGRWWQGKWTEKDIRNIVGAKASSFLVESLAEKMADTFVKGEIEVGDWSSQRGAAVQFVLGPAAKTPMRIPLNEISPAEAAAYATKLFTEIALQAQSRKCRLHGSSFDPPVSIAPVAATRAAGPSKSVVTSEAEKSANFSSKHKASTVAASESHTAASKRKVDTAEEEIAALKAELAKAKRQQQQQPSAVQTNSAKLQSIQKSKAPAATRPKGSSLANPTKKARKYEALEFDSD